MAQKGPAARDKAPARKGESARAKTASRFFLHALKASALVTLAAGLVSLIAFYFAGYSASWRTILRFVVQVLPLLPMMWLCYMIVHGLARLMRLPRTLALALVLIGTAGALIVAPASVLAAYNIAFAASGDDLDWDGSLIDLLFTAGASLGLYLITGARLWLPYGMILPPIAGFLYWKASRLP